MQQAEVEILASYEAGQGSDTAGSTLCAILLVDDKLHVAHVGDSRAVLGRGAEPIQLTRDHKPGCQIEAARIEQDDPHADISGDGYMYGELAVARAIGSAAWKRDPSKRALIPTPDLVSIQLQPDDDFVVLATDGLWDKVDNTQVRTLLGLFWVVLRGWLGFRWWAVGVCLFLVGVAPGWNVARAAWTKDACRLLSQLASVVLHNVRAGAVGQHVQKGGKVEDALLWVLQRACARLVFEAYQAD